MSAVSICAVSSQRSTALATNSDESGPLSDRIPWRAVQAHQPGDDLDDARRANATGHIDGQTLARKLVRSPSNTRACARESVRRHHVGGDAVAERERLLEVPLDLPGQRTARMIEVEQSAAAEQMRVMPRSA